MFKRIIIDKKDKKLGITIFAFKDSAKQKMLLAWIILFSVYGIAIISQFFENYDNNTKFFLKKYYPYFLDV